MADRTRTVESKPFAERESWELTFALKKPDGTAIADTDLSALTLFISNNDAAKTPINMGSPVAKRDVLNANGGTVDENGNVVIAIAPDDMVLVDGTKAIETHILLVEWAWDSGAKESAHEWAITVKNLHHRPTAGAA